MKNSIEIQVGLKYTNDNEIKAHQEEDSITCCTQNITLGDIAGYPETDEEKDRNNFISILISRGYNKEKAEAVYETMKGMVDLFNVPVSAILADAIRQMDFEVENSQDELRDIGIKCLELMVGMFQNITNNIKEKMDIIRGTLQEEKL